MWTKLINFIPLSCQTLQKSESILISIFWFYPWNNFMSILFFHLYLTQLKTGISVGELPYPVLDSRRKNLKSGSLIPRERVCSARLYQAWQEVPQEQKNVTRGSLASRLCCVSLSFRCCKGSSLPGDCSARRPSCLQVFTLVSGPCHMASPSLCPNGWSCLAGID